MNAGTDERLVPPGPVNESVWHRRKTMATMTMKRTGITVTDSQGATGKRGTLTVEGTDYHSIERGDGYKYLRPGTYDCEMAYWTSSGGTKAEAIRVLGSYSAGRIYIHPANWPHQLAGCIAPGTTKLPDGVRNSAKALKSILTALGGFSLGKKVSLEVSE
jgi:hypothetical protein